MESQISLGDESDAVRNTSAELLALTRTRKLLLQRARLCQQGIATRRAFIQRALTTHDVQRVTINNSGAVTLVVSRQRPRRSRQPTGEQVMQVLRQCSPDFAQRVERVLRDANEVEASNVVTRPTLRVCLDKNNASMADATRLLDATLDRALLLPAVYRDLQRPPLSTASLTDATRPCVVALDTDGSVVSQTRPHDSLVDGDREQHHNDGADDPDEMYVVDTPV